MDGIVYVKIGKTTIYENKIYKKEGSHEGESNKSKGEKLQVYS